MRSRVVWTAALDEKLCRLRQTGMTWDALAVDMGLGRNTVLERARKLGARTKRTPLAAELEEARDRAPRPAGHPDCWGLLTAGTVLEGEPYPYPVFL
jgi:hypothetical protein